MGAVEEEFRRIIAEGIRENQFLSYKRFGDNGDDKYPWLRSVCAFLNTNGGKVYLGLGEDNKKVPEGIWPHSRYDRDEISRIVTSRIFPQITGAVFGIDSDTPQDGDRKGSIFIIKVKQSQQRPHMYNGTCYWRRDDEDATMNIDQIKRTIYEATAESLLIDELKQNYQLLEEITKSLQGNLPKNTNKALAFSFSKLQTQAWEFIWNQGLVTTLGQDFGELRVIYVKTQQMNDILELARGGSEIIVVDEANSGTYLPGSVRDKANTLQSYIRAFFQKKDSKR